MPIVLSKALAAAATLGPFVAALPRLQGMPGVHGIWDTSPETLKWTSGKISEWGSRGGLAGKFLQTEAALRPALDPSGRISMNGTSRLDLAMPAGSLMTALTIALRWTTLLDTGGFQTLFAATSGDYLRSFWSPTLVRTRAGDNTGLRDFAAAPSMPSGAVFVISGATMSLHTGGKSLSWPIALGSNKSLQALHLGAQTTSAAPDAHHRFQRAAVFTSALSGADLTDLKKWVGA